MQCVDADVTAALEQEAGELTGVARWVADGEEGKVLAQDRVEPFRLAERPDVLDPTLRSPDSSGSTPTDAGELRWIKVEVTGRTDPNDLAAALRSRRCVHRGQVGLGFR
jgi:hypothetical protein